MFFNLNWQAMVVIVGCTFFIIIVSDVQVSNERPKVVGFTIQQPFEWYPG